MKLRLTPHCCVCTSSGIRTWRHDNLSALYRLLWRRQVTGAESSVLPRLRSPTAFVRPTELWLSRARRYKIWFDAINATRSGTGHYHIHYQFSTSTARTQQSLPIFRRVYLVHSSQRHSLSHSSITFLRFCMAAYTWYNFSRKLRMCGSCSDSRNKVGFLCDLYLVSLSSPGITLQVMTSRNFVISISLETHLVIVSVQLRTRPV